MAFTATVLVSSGCSQGKLDSQLDAGFKKLFQPRETPQRQMLVAFSSDDADVRREAVLQVSRSKLYNREWAIKSFITMAKLESDAQTRCIAIRALARTGDPRTAETMLAVLNYRDYPQQVWPPTPIVRWDATAALADLSAAGRVPEDQREAVRKTLIERLRSDSERHARIAAARALGYYSDPETVRALVGALRDDDFAVVHQAEDSLVRLTGVTHRTDVTEWEAWLATNESEEFAHAGEVPESRRPLYKNGFEKTLKDTRELLGALWPGKKEQ